MRRLLSPFLAALASRAFTIPTSVPSFAMRPFDVLRLLAKPRKRPTPAKVAITHPTMQPTMQIMGF